MRPPILSFPRLGVPWPPVEFDPHYKFVSSPFVSASVLGGVRGLLGLYALTTLCTVLGFDVHAGSGKSFLSYFTELSYIGLTAYYIAAAVQTIAYARWGAYPLRRWPRILQALHVILQSTITFPFIVTVVFWVLLASSSTFKTRYSGWSNISMHAMNSPLRPHRHPLHQLPARAMAHPAHPHPPPRMLPRRRGFYTYTFLDPVKEGGLLAAYIVGIAAGEIIVFLLARGVVALRQRLVVRMGRLPGPERSDDVVSREGLDEWEQVERPIVGAEKRRNANTNTPGRTRANVNDSGVAVGEEV
ncbi:hypothetical protein C8F01DRAFT_1156497 [Mycena amicta]|nr:hypothetical protein C8F01DRAFT_1156497 [Mycena amicta]